MQKAITIARNCFANEMNIVPAIAEGTTIPRVIHQTFYSKLLPSELQENGAKIKALNPGWEYKLYDDADITAFLRENYAPRILNYFNRISPSYGAAKADLFRYLLLYKCGGLYLDIKSTLTKPLDDILRADDRYLLSNWRNKKGEPFENWGLHTALGDMTDGEFQQWHIVAAPGHPFLKAVIENVLRNIDRYHPSLHGTGKDGVLRLTGPIAYTLAIAPLLHLYKHRFADSQADLGFEYSIYNNSAHKIVFRSHYANLTEPIVKIGVKLSDEWTSNRTTP